jgi:hypothetical protein
MSVEAATNLTETSISLPSPYGLAAYRVPCRGSAGRN